MNKKGYFHSLYVNSQGYLFLKCEQEYIIKVQYWTKKYELYYTGYIKKIIIKIRK